MKRANLDELKSVFDRVFIKHHTENNPPIMPGTMKAMTCVALVKGNKIYIGISACDFHDQFSRKKGSLIAIGRAMHEYELDIGDEIMRDSDYRRQSISFPLSFTVEAPSEITTRDIVQTAVFDGMPWEIGFGEEEELVEELAEETCSLIGCVGNCNCGNHHAQDNFEG